MGSPSLCLFRSPVPWIFAGFVPLLTILSLLGFGYLSIILLTCLVLVISTTVYFTFSTQKPLPVVKMEKEECPKSEHNNNTCLPQMEEELLSKLQPENETISQNHEIYGGGMSQIDERKEGQEGGMSQIHENLVIRLSDLGSDDGTSVEDSSTMDWPSQENVNQSSVCSDGSISDEDSLIEISLPTGHYVSCYEEEPNFKFMANSIFQQHSNTLIELLSEINEENLIEIDISMGSIKCSRFEIEA